MKKKLSTLLIISSTIALCGCSKSVDLEKIFNPNADFDKGMKAYEQKDYDVAIIDFTNALNAHPDSYSAMCYLGTSYMYKGDDTSAERVLQDAVSKFPSRWNAYTFLGELKRKQHDYASSIDFYETALALESMPDSSKAYYKNLINEIKREERNWNAQGDIPIREKINPKNAVPSYKVEIPLDKTVWEKAYEVANDKNGITEYGKKGEDVKNYQWTELVTVQYFALNDSFQYSPSEYLASHIAPIENMAKDTKKSFVRKNLHETNSEILYEWSFDQGKESEIARIVQTPSAIYHIHYAKKGTISEADKTKWIGILKAAKAGVQAAGASLFVILAIK